MPPPHTYSAHEVPLVNPSPGSSSGFVKDRLARRLADALRVNLTEVAAPPPGPARSNTGSGPKASQKRPGKAVQRIDDDAEEREADAEAASIGPTPGPPPPGSHHLFSHTLILTIPPPSTSELVSRRREVDADLDRLRAVLDEADPMLLATEGLPLGCLHLDFSPDNGPLALLKPPVLPPSPMSRSWVSPSHIKQTLLLLDKVGADLGSSAADLSCFSGKAKASDRSWLAALAYFTSPALRSDDASGPRFVSFASLSLHPTPDPSSALSHAFHLRLDVHMTPAAFNRFETALVAEAQRRLLTDVLPMPADPAAYATHGVHTTIPFFFEVLKPAPDCGEDNAARSELATLCNPPGLKLDLLPFQARAVRWLLEREGVRIAGPAVENEIEVKSEDDSDAEFDMQPRASSFNPARGLMIRPAVALLPARRVEGSEGASWAFEPVELPLSPPSFHGASAVSDNNAHSFNAESMPGDEVSFLFNRLSGEVMRSDADVRQLAAGGLWDVDAQPGGMLCEEMGLGKTIEVMSLLLLHPSPAFRTCIVDSSTAEVTATRCKQVKATLIVSPESLITQWKDELEGHSPGLRVLVYDGYKSLPFKISTADEVERIREERDAQDGEDAEFPSFSKRKSSSSKSKGRGSGHKRARLKETDTEGDESLWWDFLAEDGGYDVVLCSYATLERDFSVAAQPKQRPRRGGVYYSRELKPRSPLVMCEWWRIAMDEVQLSGKPRIEDMVSLLPRVNSLAVSGTPAKSKIEDLRSTLSFLRQFPAAYFPRLVEPGLVSVFERLFQRIATRTTKSRVTAELAIPPQTRLLVPIDLTPIELAYYDSTFARGLDELHFDVDGNGFDLSVSLARYWVNVLRQISTHPQIGGLGIRANPQRERQQDRRLNLGENLLSMADVLNKMLDSNAAEVATARRTLTLQQIDHAHLLIFKVQAELGKVPDTDETRNDPRRLQARELLLLALEETARDLLELVPAAEAAEAADAASGHDDSSDDDEDLSEEQRRTLNRRLVAIGRVRDVRTLRHRALFLLGDWFHVAQDVEAETSYYDQAAALRQVLHARPRRIADSGIAKLKRKLEPASVTMDDLEVPMPEFSRGIQTARAIDAAKEVLQLLAKNGELVGRWRARLLSMLSKGVEEPLEDTELVTATVNMDEYQAGAVVQEIIDHYMQAYLTAIADRREILDGHRDQLAVLELRPLPKRKAGPLNASRLQTLNATANGDDNEQEEDLDLGQKLMRERSRCVLNPFVVSRARVGRPPLKNYMHDLVTTSQISRSEVEVQIATHEGKRLRALIKTQLTMVERLTAEAKILEAIYNLRITYFKDKQLISDSVAELDMDTARNWEKRVDIAIRKQKEVATKIGGLVSRGRYLKHMDAVNRGDQAVDEHTCAICLDEGFQKGVLFVCSHLLCLNCWHTLLRKTPQGPACPTCRERINPSEVNRIILSASEVNRTVDQDGAGKDSKGKGKAPRREVDRLAALNVFDAEERREISQEIISGTWGSKIDFLVKHLLYLAVHDRGYKAIVFSAFPDGLHIIQKALAENGIPFSAASSTNIRTVAHDFKADDTKRVFLLHGERESSGLTLTCCKYIWLLEPCVAPSFELQAVGRVDRMGQKQETKVFCLFSKDTVDESIVHLQVAKGTSIYLKSAAGTSMPSFSTLPNDGKVDDGNNRKLSTKKGDFVAKSNDLAALLFPDRHLFGLPAQGDIVELNDSIESEQEAIARRQLDGHMRADAAERRAERSSYVDATYGPAAAAAGPGPSSARFDRNVRPAASLADM